VGDFEVGKTSIIHSYFLKPLNTVQSTLGIDFFSKSIRVGEQDVHLSMWDTAGSERFHSLIHSYLRDSNIIIIVYDLSKPMHNLTYWLRIAEQHRPNVLGILGNKSDLTQSCTNDLRNVLIPYERLQRQVVRGKCSSRDPKSVQRFMTKCLKQSVQNDAGIPEKITPIRISKKKTQIKSCCM